MMSQGACRDKLRLLTGRTMGRSAFKKEQVLRVIRFRQFRAFGKVIEVDAMLDFNLQDSRVAKKFVDACSGGREGSQVYEPR